MPTQSDRSTHVLEDFLGLRDSLRSEPMGSGGRQVCDALTAKLDEALAALAADAESSFEFAVVATGGYGRRELSPFSDVDLMLLHEGGDPSDLAAKLFRPLWDSNLRLGHAVRDVKQASLAARRAVDTHTTLLTSRLVAGSRDLFDRLTVEIAAVTRARPLRRHLVSEERARRAATPYLLMATDVKMGRGGLRTLHGFEWERRREELIGRFSAGGTESEAQAHESLLMVRNALHAAAGRRYDVFSQELREPVARWLGRDLYEICEILVDAIETGDRLASQRWPELLESGDSLPRRVLNRLMGRTGRSEPTEAPSARDLISILRSGERGRDALERLRVSGHLESILPEWSHIRVTPQLAPFHEHPVGAHLWRTVDEMELLIHGDDEHYSGIAAEVDSHDALTLAAFLHDIGKGRGGDHEEIGAEIARAVCHRLQLASDASELVEQAVRHHLLLAKTATRRDLDDPAVIDDVAATLGELRLLQVLYLLTVADSRATGPSMWNEWKARLVRTLFVRCATRFGADRPALGTTRQQVLAEAGLERLPEIEAHIDRMPAEYLLSSSSDDVLWHVDLISGLADGSALDTRPGRPVDTAVVVGRDLAGFRNVVAQTFAANGIDVLEARLSSRQDGIVVDTFRVRDDRTGESVPADRWDQVREDINSALAGELDAQTKVADRARAYSTVEGLEVDPRVQISVDEGSEEWIVMVKCSDRIGRLAEILSVLSEADLEITLAKLDSRGGEVVDTFHVHGPSLPGDEAERADLERRLQASIRP